MLIQGKDKWLPGKETWSWNSCVLSVGYNQPGKEGWKLPFVTRMKPFQSEINSGRSAVPSPWTLSKERNTGPRVGSTGRQHFKSVCLSLYQVLAVQVWPQVTGWSYTQTGSRNSTNQWERKAPQPGQKEKGTKQNKKTGNIQKSSSCRQSQFLTKIRVVGVTTELGGWQWGRGGLQLWQKLLQKEAVSHDLEVPSELSQACSLCLSHFTSYIKPGTHMRLSNQRGG